jgi:signal transduction histidine kinase
VLPDVIPHFGIGSFFGLASSVVMVILCSMTVVFYPHYRPLRGLLLFYLFMTFFFFGWVIYALQRSPESILWGYRINYAAMAFLPASWLWFYFALLNKTHRLWTWALTGISLLLACLALFGKGPSFFGVPLEPDSIAAEGLRPPSQLLRPLIQYFSLGACLIYLLLVTLRYWRAKRPRPAYLLPIVIGLLFFLLGGLNDALRSKGIILFREQLFWLTSSGLSIFFAIAVTLRFRSLEKALQKERTAHMDAVEHSRRELERLNRVKSIAIHHLSHELRTPLAVIKGTLQILRRKFKADPPLSGEEKSFELVGKQLDRLMEIQSETDKIIQSYQELEPERIHLHLFAGEILDKVKQKAAHRDLQFSLDGEKDLSLKFAPSILEEILEGLLKNAIENTPDEGLIRVVVELKAQWVQLKVQDFGVGITNENQRNLFDGLFHTVDNELYSSKKPYDFGAGGKGLNLLRLKTYGQRIGYEISLASQRCIYLPTDRDLCPGRISSCSNCKTRKDCLNSGGSMFCLTFSLAGE